MCTHCTVWYWLSTPTSSVYSRHAYRAMHASDVAPVHTRCHTMNVSQSRVRRPNALDSMLSMNITGRAVCAPCHQDVEWPPARETSSQKTITCWAEWRRHYPRGIFGRRVARASSGEPLYGTHPAPRTRKMPWITSLYSISIMVFCIVARVRLYWAEKRCWEVNLQNLNKIQFICLLACSTGKL